MNEGKNIKITPMSQETLVLFTEAMHDIKWKGLINKNNDKMYAPRQFMPQSEYVRSHKEVIEENKCKLQETTEWGKTRNHVK